MNRIFRDYLVVDDEPDLCWALKHILEAQGYTGRSVTTGREALDLLALEHFNFVFLDAKLPDIEGLELAEKMFHEFPGIKIILVSGYYYPDDPEIVQAKKRGILKGFIAKPFKNQQVIETIIQKINIS